MAIVKMSKFNLLLFNSERKNLLRELQKFDYVHFLDLKESEELRDYNLGNIEEPESIVAINEEINRVNYAIEILNQYKEKESKLKTLKEGMPVLEFSQLEEKANKIDYKLICKQVVKLNSDIDLLSQDIDKIKNKIKELSPWVKLDVSIKELESLQEVDYKLGYFPGRLKKNVEEALVESEYTYVEILGENQGYVYTLILTNDEEKTLVDEILRNNNFTDIKVELEDRPGDEVSKLKEIVSEKQKLISKYKEDLKKLSEDIMDFQVVYEYLMNMKLRITESENFLTTDKINVIEGYVPTDKSEEFTEVIKENLDNNIYYFVLEEADEDDEDVPILLKNSKYTQSFESLTTMYAYPKYNEIDPTGAMAPLYSFFFGMMVADVGYGLVLLIATAILPKIFNLTQDQEKTIRFFYCQSFFIILWGLIYGSFFSFSIPTGILDPTTQYMEVLILSIAFGIVHIYVGLGLDAYNNIKKGKFLDAIYDTGFWYMALTGAIVLIVGIGVGLDDIVTNVFLYIMIIGMIGIVLTGGRDSPSIGGRLGGGIYSLYGITGYVGDFISYSRLMALGLSGGYLASAITDLSFMLFDIKVIGIIFGAIIFVVGHLFNLFLSLLSAYVHDIRLTYVEFFGKFYEGGSKAFKSLRSDSKYFNIK